MDRDALDALINALNGMSDPQGRQYQQEPRSDQLQEFSDQMRRKPQGMDEIGALISQLEATEYGPKASEQTPLERQNRENWSPEDWARLQKLMEPIPDPRAELIGPTAKEKTPEGFGEFMQWFNREDGSGGPQFGKDRTPYYENPPITPSAPEGLRMSGNISDRRMENHPLIGKLARQKTRGERHQAVLDKGGMGWDAAVQSGKPTTMFNDDIEATISEGRYGEYGWLDDYIEQMARIARGEK
jgi:hypothetical protein